MRVKLKRVSLGVMTIIFASAAAAAPLPPTISFQASALGGGTFSGGTIVAPSGSSSDVQVTTFSGVPLNELIVSNDGADNGTYKNLSLSLSFNTTTDQLTLTGAISALAGLSSSTTLETIQLSGGLYGTTAGAFTLDSTKVMSEVTSVTFSNQLLSDLGLAGSAMSVMNFTVSGPVVTGDANTYQSNSVTLNSSPRVSAAPEPGSVLLLCAGFACLVFWRRKRWAAAH